MKYYPLQFKLESRRCLIVGGGRVAQRRCKALLSAAAVVDVIAPEITAELRQLLLDSDGELFEQPYADTLVDRDYFCVIAATDSTTVNQQVADYARSRNIPVNRADDRNLCDFIFPAVIDRGPITIAISNNGGSPVLSRLLKRQLSQFLPDGYGELSDFVGRQRARVKQALPDERERIDFWQHVLQGAIAEAIFAGNAAQAQALFDCALQAPEQFRRIGEVYLIGAGPGDPDLLTLRAFRLIQQSDVVLYDRLVSPEIMNLVPQRAECIYVGKRRSEHAVPQADINQLLVEHAGRGKRVARLKGGDPFIFGRGGEEIEELAAARIPFQVVPGITAANGCSAYAGIPLTHRDYAQSVQFVTGQLKDGSVDLNWPELISEGKTLVFYMGLSSLPVICESLRAHGMADDMNVALVEKGTTREQRVLVSTVAELPQRLQQLEVSSPSLFIVGRVVQLADKLQWYATGSADSHLAPADSGESKR
jgi:uroporphyrin-III C-methyltransferase/precorrin-2 dehydrogenase/sirohydrochlorin ferrochelatase